MAEVASAYVSLLASAKGFGMQIDSQIGPDLDKSGKSGGRRFGSAFGGAAKALIGPALALISVAAVGKFLKSSIAEAREAQKVGAQTAAVIKSTGGAANVTAKQFGTLSTAISLKTGIDDEQIQAGENMLATFTNVRNELGKGNDIFSQATKAATDLGVATKTGPVQASLLLGKALNDPAKGLSRLQRIGVTFTDQQKAQVAALTKSGDKLGAQKIILKELNKEFGGSAAAQATAGDKLKVSFDNLKESVGTALLPLIDKLAAYLTNSLIPALYKLPPVFHQIGAFVAPVIAFFKSFGDGSNDAGSKVRGFGATVTSVLASVRSIFVSVVTIVTTLWRAFGPALTAAIGPALTSILTQVRGFLNIIAGIFKVIAAVLTGDWAGAWAGIKQIAQGAGQVLKGIVQGALNLIKTAFRLAGAAILGIIRGAFGALRGVASVGVSALLSLVKGIPGKIKSSLGNLGNLLVGAGKALINGLISGIKSRLGALGGVMGSVAKKVAGFFHGSPIKEGPLKAAGWNKNAPGKRLIQEGVIDGIISRKGALASAMSDVTSGASLSSSVAVPSGARLSSADRGALGAGGAGAPIDYKLLAREIAKAQNGQTLQILQDNRRLQGVLRNG